MTSLLKPPPTPTKQSKGLVDALLSGDIPTIKAKLRKNIEFFDHPPLPVAIYATLYCSSEVIQYFQTHQAKEYANGADCYTTIQPLMAQPHWPKWTATLTALAALRGESKLLTAAIRQSYHPSCETISLSCQPSVQFDTPKGEVTYLDGIDATTTLLMGNEKRPLTPQETSFIVQTIEDLCHGSPEDQLELAEFLVPASVVSWAPNPVLEDPRLLPLYPKLAPILAQIAAQTTAELQCTGSTSAAIHTWLKGYAERYLKSKLQQNSVLAH